MPRSKITDDQFKSVLSDYASGITITECCKKHKIDCHQFYTYLQDNGQDASQNYARACSLNAEQLADQILEIAEENDDPRNKQVRIDAIKWVLGKKQPKKYGERIEISDPSSKIPTVLKIELVQPKTRQQIGTDKQDISDVTGVSD